MRQRVELLLSVLFLLGLIAASRSIGKYVSSAQVENRKAVVVVDAGHGGADPGKVGVNDAKEKDINLAIAKKVVKLLEKRGVKVVMTRTDDSMLAKSDAQNKKAEDMKARVEIIDKELPDLVVSIHQNSYHEENVSGAQVFYYSHSEKGREAAEIMQQALLSFDEDNHRQAKANDTYYLLKRTESATIIVECGFLSNQEEAALLVTEDYQDQVAQAICDGVTAYLGVD